MIKKLIMGVITILLVVFTILIIKNGISIGSFEIYGISELKKANDNLDTKINIANNLTGVDYPKKISELNEVSKKLTSKKQEYSNLTTNSTETQLKEISELKEYEIEYLWTKVGNYATNEGVKIKMDVTTAEGGEKSEDGRMMYDLKFLVDGSYIGISNFIKNIENDTFLEFNIDNFSMKKGNDENSLNAGFVVKNVPINLNELTEPEEEND